jgi:hypothetical protein
MQPVGGFSVNDVPKIPPACDLKHDYPIVIAKGAEVQKNLYDGAWGERCLNDPKGLKRPAIIDRRS